jgi:hypothetical protein
MNDVNIHQRIQDWYTVEEETWSSIQDLGSGIWVYKDVFSKNKNTVNEISKILESGIPGYEWRQATVGYLEYMPDYRDCYDFKYKPYIIQSNSPSTQKLEDIYRNFYYRQLQVVKDYSRKHNIGELRYWEAMNLVKYGPGEHFQEHHDHGYSYNCTVSLVGYLNDDYEGGELSFRLQNLMIKPEAGDLFIFPSNFMYPHRAMPVKSGTKYSLVTMLDYSDKFHTPQFYRESGS